MSAAEISKWEMPFGIYMFLKNHERSAPVVSRRSAHSTCWSSITTHYQKLSMFIAFCCHARTFRRECRFLASDQVKMKGQDERYHLQRERSSLFNGYGHSDGNVNMYSSKEESGGSRRGCAFKKGILIFSNNYFLFRFILF